MSSSQIKAEALQLSAEERAELAQALWESLDASYFPISDEYLAELERRDQALTASGGGSTHEEVMKAARRARR